MFSTLQFKDFRLLWFGLLISNLGTWMQLTATGYFIAKLAGNPHTASLFLGFQGLARAVPVLLFSPLAGLVADTRPRRQTLFITNAVLSFFALLLAVLTSFKHMNLIGLLLINACTAAAQSFDAPARQSWVPLMVPREYIGNAIGLNSVAFNAPAVLGPAVAGILVSYSIAGAFYVNAAATLAVVVALVFMRPAPPSTSRREPFLPSISSGLRFLFGHKILGWVIAMFIISALLVRPYSILLPAFIVSALHATAKGLGIAIAATGVGGFAGALLTAYLGTRERRGTIWAASALVMACGVFMLGFIWNLYASLPVLFAIGAATMTFLGASNTLIQTLSPDEVRGRAIAVYSMVALGLVPGGALIVGSLASLIGLHEAFWLVGGITSVIAAWGFIARPILRTI